MEINFKKAFVLGFGTYFGWTTAKSVSSIVAEPVLKLLDREEKKLKSKHCETIVVDSAETAERIVKDIDNEIQRYGVASVAYMYECAGMTCDYALCSLGWTDISGYKIVSASDGCTLKMPKANYIEKETKEESNNENK